MFSFRFKRGGSSLQHRHRAFSLQCRKQTKKPDFYFVKKSFLQNKNPVYEIILRKKLHTQQLIHFFQLGRKNDVSPTV
jgi:hypothetical protein